MTHGAVPTSLENSTPERPTSVSPSFRTPGTPPSRPTAARRDGTQPVAGPDQHLNPKSATPPMGEVLRPQEAEWVSQRVRFDVHGGAARHDRSDIRASLVDVCVDCSVGVPLRTVTPRSILPTHVLRTRNHFKVVGANTLPVPAQMVNRHPLRDWPPQHLPRQPVRVTKAA